LTRIWKFLAYAGIILWAISPVRNAYAGEGEEAAGAPVVKPAQLEKEKDRVPRRLESMTRRLALTAEQQEAIKPILADEAARLDKLRAEGNLAIVEKRSRRKKLQDATYDRIRPLLSGEQRVKREEQLKEATERRKNRKNMGAETVPAR
jgi:hypothetical protein